MGVEEAEGAAERRVTGGVMGGLRRILRPSGRLDTAVEA